jgi:hypothetical protein
MLHLHLASKSAAGRLLGSRRLALPIRDELEQLLSSGNSVAIDFADTNPTQSFIDELIGVLVLQRGKSILSCLIFRNCSDHVKAILNLVVSDRLEQHRLTSDGTHECV